MSELPPLKSLRVFEACVRLGSFTLAARELNVGQPAVSHQIHALEADLGVTLFARSGAKAVPTAVALKYHHSISVALSDMAIASSELRQSVRPRGLSLATYPGIANFWIMPRLQHISSAMDDIAIRVTTAERDRDIPLQDVDCAILFGLGDWPGYDSRLLIGESVVPVASPAVAEQIDPLSPDAILAKGRLIHLEDPDQRWFTWADWRQRRCPDAKPGKRGITVTNHGIAIHQAMQGQGIALGWNGVINDLLDSRLLVALDPIPLTSDRGYHLVAKKGFLQSEIGELLVATLQV